MISDVLHDAIREIDEYLDTFWEVYQGTLRERILNLRNEMEDIREELDNPPSTQ